MEPLSSLPGGIRLRPEHAEREEETVGHSLGGGIAAGAHPRQCGPPAAHGKIRRGEPTDRPYRTTVERAPSGAVPAAERRHVGTHRDRRRLFSFVLSAL